MALGLPVRLRLLIPAVENSIGGGAFRPGRRDDDARAARTVEISNTDAEGRLILADALADADAETPRLLLDAATLTGAARVALGPELPALFTPDDALADDLLRGTGSASFDPLWRLPLHAPYLSYMKARSPTSTTPAASRSPARSPPPCSSRSSSARPRAWAHLDMFAWNDDNRPGRRAAARPRRCERCWP